MLSVVDSIAQGAFLNNEAEHVELNMIVMFHPSMITIITIFTIVLVIIPAYIAVWIANKAFIPHSIIMAGLMISSLIYGQSKNEIAQFIQGCPDPDAGFLFCFDLSRVFSSDYFISRGK